MEINIIHHLPSLSLLFGALVSILRVAFNSKNFPVGLYGLVFAGLATAIQFSYLLGGHAECVLPKDFDLSRPTFFVQFLILIALLASIVNFLKPNIEQKNKAEKLVLLFFISIGALVLCSSREIITWYLSLEIISISSYALVASNIKSKQSSEAAIKYFTQGALGSSLILLGLVLFYGFTGASVFSEIAAALSQVSLPIIIFSGALVISGLAFKLGLVPFHYWVADVYEGASSSVTVFLASVVKVAAAYAMYVFLTEVLVDYMQYYEAFLWLLIVFSIVAGNLLALRQKSFKRLLAYSAIAHTGYLAIGFLNPSDVDFQIAFVAYLVLYLILTLITFTIACIAEDSTNDNLSLSDLTGLAHNYKYVGGILALALIALSGLPPVLFALIAKIYLIKVALASGYIGLAIFVILGAVIGSFYYFGLIGKIYNSDQDQSTRSIQYAPLQVLSLVLLASILVYYTIFPFRLYDYLAVVFQGGA